ncbi:MAG: fasciclin domain-containing protein [Dysgonamonadaceae bacterium]|jgi:hypothetical protein|nr:fasciclin domain-containing protein [Dysgonamonadaceae bacterium]
MKQLCLTNAQKHVNRWITAIFLAVLTGGCTMFGYDLQENDEYNHSVRSSELNVDAWTFMNQRSDLFSGMLSAIEYVKDIEPGIEDLYKAYDNTYLLLTDMALTIVDNNSYAYFNMNRIYDPLNSQWLIPTSWTAYPKRQVLQLLKYHVIKAPLSYGQLSETLTWYDTYAAGDTAKIAVYYTKDANLRLYFNNYADVPSVAIPGSSSTVTYTNIMPRTTSLIATNGIVHVMDRWLIPPTRKAVFGY